MKFRGTLGGLNIQLDASDTPHSVAGALASRAALLHSGVIIEIDAEAALDTLDAVRAAVAAAGGEVTHLRAARVPAPAPTPTPISGDSAAQESASPPNSAAAPSPASPPTVSGHTPHPTHSHDQHTVVLSGGVRSGFRGEYAGSVVVLGDVNPGSELVAGGDVIVLGALRGVVHAGADGTESAIVWARPIASAQIRIAGAVARAPQGSSLSTMKKLGGAESEVARLRDGQIVIEASHIPPR